MNGRATLARKSQIERAAADSPLALRLLRVEAETKQNTFEAFTDYELTLLTIKMIEERYTDNTSLVAMYDNIKGELYRSGLGIALGTLQRLTIENAIMSIIARWKAALKRTDC